ncbi:MAG: DUF4388 domain-containing protein [Vicinamibacteria bacterium]
MSRTNPELQGFIRQFSLPDIVQFLSSASKTGKLGLTASGAEATGSIFFDGGTVVHAELGASEGEEAFFELMRWKEGSFEFLPGETSSKSSVQKHSAMLLMEGARRSDEWGLLSEQIPDTRLVPEFILPHESETGRQITLNTREWMVLAKVDGRRSLEEIAHESGLSEYHVCRLLYPLLTNQLIRLREPSR